MDGFFFIPMAFSCLYLWKVLSCGFECIKGKNHPCWAKFPCPLKIGWSFASSPAATLTLLTEETVVEMEAAVLLLSSVSDYYLHSIKAWSDGLSLVCSGIFSHITVFWATNNASKSFSTFSNGVGHFIPCPVLLCDLLCFLCSPGDWVIRKVPSRNHQSRTSATASSSSSGRRLRQICFPLYKYSYLDYCSVPADWG